MNRLAARQQILGLLVECVDAALVERVRLPPKVPVHVHEEAPIRLDREVPVEETELPLRRARRRRIAGDSPREDVGARRSSLILGHRSAPLSNDHARVLRVGERVRVVR